MTTLGHNWWLVLPLLVVALSYSPAGIAGAPAVLIGVGHIQNYLLFGKPLDDTLFQIVSAGLYGFCSPGKAPDAWQYTVLVFLLCYGFVLTRKPAPRRLRAAAVFADSLRKLRSCA